MEDAMMSRYEKWEYERDMDEIIDRLSELLISIMLMSIKQISKQYQPLMERVEKNQSNDVKF
jgi:hypothetical protein